MKRKLEIKKAGALTLTALLVGVLLLGGTYAWHTIKGSTAKNEVLGNGLNPGGRLHDDFNGMNVQPLTSRSADGKKVKAVYVENFTDPDDHGDVIFARIRLDEYLEIGEGAGEATNSVTKEAKSIEPGKEIEKVKEWTPYVWGDPNSKFRKYVNLETGGETVYMPTYNRDKDSLEADINGTLGGLDKDNQTTHDDYSDYQQYVIGSNEWGVELYDANAQGVDELKEAGIKPEQIIEAIMDTKTGNLNISSTDTELDLGNGIPKLPIEFDQAGDIYIKMNQSDAKAAIKAVVPDSPHTAKKTLCAEPVITMADWKEDVSNGGKGGKAGPYWVADTDGWYYWAWPIEPGTATGCLLNAVSLNTGTSEGSSLSGKKYYYGLNVVGQFATANDWGTDAADPADKTGFYKDGLTPAAKELLNSISVRENYSIGIAVTNGETEVQEVSPGDQVTMSFGLTNANGEEVPVDQSRVVWTVAEEEAAAAAEGIEVTKTGFHDPDKPNVLSIAKDETRTSLTVNGCYTDAKGKRFTQSCIVQIVPAKEEAALTFPVYTIQKTGNDKDNFVILIMGDGYTKDQQEKFIADATVRAKGMLAWSPYKDYSDRINIYAVQAVSNASGMSDYDTSYDVDTYFKITYFGSAPRFGTQEGINRAEALKKEIKESYLDPGASLGKTHILSNTTNIDRGAALNQGYSVSTVHPNSEDGKVMAHELAHSIGGLGDEYDAKDTGENISKTSNADEIKWNKLLGFRGVGITIAGNDTTFAPGNYCMMRTAGEYFCEVCKMELARSLNDKFYVSNPAAYYIAEPEITIPHTLEETIAYDKKYRISEKNIASANGKDLEFRTVIQNIAEEELELEVSFRITDAAGMEKRSAKREYTVPAGVSWNPQAARESLSVVLEGVTGLVYGDKLEGKVVNKKTGEILTDQTRIDQKWSTVNISYQRLTGSGAEEMPEIAPTTIYVPKGSTYQLKKIPLRGATFVKNSLGQDSVVVSGDTLNITYYYK